MPKIVTWDEVVTAARTKRLMRLDVRSIEAAILAVDERLRTLEAALESGGYIDTTTPAIAPQEPAQRVRRGAKKVAPDAE